MASKAVSCDVEKEANLRKSNGNPMENDMKRGENGTKTHEKSVRRRDESRSEPRLLVPELHQLHRALRGQATGYEAHPHGAWLRPCSFTA